MSEWLRTDTHCLFFLPYWFGSYTYYLHSFSDYPCLIHLKTGIAQRTNSVRLHSHEWGPCVRAQSCPTLCEPMEFSGRNAGVGCHFLLQRIFPTQGSSQHLLWLLHCRWILYHWATWEAPEWEGKFTETQSITMVARSWGTGKWGVCIWWAQSFSLGRQEVLGWAVAMVTHQRE